MMELAEMLKANPCEDLDIYLVATVQEEYNLRGGMVAAAAIKPDFAIALDVALTGDTPDMNDSLPVIFNDWFKNTLSGEGTLDWNDAIPIAVALGVTRNE